MVPDQDLDPIPVPSEEEVDVALVWIHAQVVLDQGGQGPGPFAHVDRRARQEDAAVAGEVQHGRPTASSAGSTCASQARSLPGGTVRTTPLGRVAMMGAAGGGWWSAVTAVAICTNAGDMPVARSMRAIRRFQKSIRLRLRLLAWQ